MVFYSFWFKTSIFFFFAHRISTLGISKKDKSNLFLLKQCIKKAGNLELFYIIWLPYKQYKNFLVFIFSLLFTILKTSWIMWLKETVSKIQLTISYSEQYTDIQECSLYFCVIIKGQRKCLQKSKLNLKQEKIENDKELKGQSK